MLVRATTKKTEKDLKLSDLFDLMNRTLGYKMRLRKMEREDFSRDNTTNIQRENDQYF